MDRVKDLKAANLNVRNMPQSANKKAKEKAIKIRMEQQPVSCHEAGCNSGNLARITKWFSIVYAYWHIGLR